MADTKRDYYEILGISRDADEAAIKKAYREMAKKYHPDMHPGDKEAEAKFKEASEAYAVLIDPEKRRQYDQFGHAAFDGSAGAGGFDFNSADMGDIFGDIFGDLFGGFGFGGFGQSSRSSATAPRKGRSLQTGVRISFMEAIRGTEKELELNLQDTCEECGGSGARRGTSPVTCSRCGGSGQILTTQQTMFGTMQSRRACPDCGGRGKIIKDKCSRCGGTGFVRKHTTVSVSIPAGIDNGQTIRLRGKGEPGENGGERGDILVEVRVGTHPEFDRQDTDIYSGVTLSFAQAALGDTIRINTVDGEVEYDVKPGTQSGTRIRLRQKGVPLLRNPESRGDHYVTFTVAVPEHLTREQKEALQKYDEALGGTLNGYSKKKKGLFK